MHQVGEPRTIPTAKVIPLMLALLAAVFAFQLNASMLSPALATMEQELDTTTAAIGLTQTAFFTAAALFSLFLPRWGDLIGRRKVLVGMMAATAIGCLVAALAPNVTVLLIGRIIQGVAGPTVPLALIMLRQQIPNEKQYALLLGIVTSVNGGIAGVDALLGGWLAGHFGFRAVFWVMAAVCVTAVICVQLFTEESLAQANTPMDWKGIAPLAIALGSILTAFNEAGKLGDANWLLVAVLIIIGAIAVAAFWNIEKRVPHPLVTITYLKQRRTWALLSTTLLTMTGVFAVMNGLVPNLGQDANAGVGLSADMVSWYTLTPYAIAGLIFGPIAGWMASQLGYKLVLQIGLVGTVLGLILAVFIVGHPTKWTLLLVSIFIGVTYAGISNIMLNGLGIVLSPADNQGYLPGMNAGAFNLGAGLSFAILFAVAGAFETGYRAGLLTGVVILACALAMSLLIPKPEGIEDTVAADNAEQTPERS